MTRLSREQVRASNNGHISACVEPGDDREPEYEGVSEDELFDDAV